MKRIISVLIALYLLAFLAVGVSAAQETRIFDEANCLSTAERQQLEALSEEITAEFPISVYVVTVDDYRSISYSNIDDAARQYYNSNNLGFGSSRDGLLLMLSMDDRDYALIAYGKYAIDCFTDYGRIKLSEKFVDDFRHDDWYGGFEDYLKVSKDYLKEARDNRPVDNYPADPKKVNSVGAVISLLLGYPVSSLVCGGMKAKMRSVKPAAAANQYLNVGSVNFSDRSEVFTHTTQVRTPIPRQSRDDSGPGPGIQSNFGGSGSHVDSGGFAGHSGKF